MDASPSSKNLSLELPLAIVWALVVATAGGYLCGLAVSRYGEVGSISLWGLGVLAGVVARRMLAAPSRLVGLCLIAACATALVIAEVCWLHWNTKQGEESWWAALTLLPTFVQEYELAALIAAVFTALGAWSAYRSTAGGRLLVAAETE